MLWLVGLTAHVHFHSSTTGRYFSGGVKFYFRQFCSEAEIQVSKPVCSDLENKPLMISRLVQRARLLIVSLLLSKIGENKI